MCRWTTNEEVTSWILTWYLIWWSCLVSSFSSTSYAQNSLRTRSCNSSANAYKRKDTRQSLSVSMTVCISFCRSVYLSVCLHVNHYTIHWQCNIMTWCRVNTMLKYLGKAVGKGFDHNNAVVVISLLVPINRYKYTDAVTTGQKFTTVSRHTKHFMTNTGEQPRKINKKQESIWCPEISVHIIHVTCFIVDTVSHTCSLLISLTFDDLLILARYQGH